MIFYDCEISARNVTLNIIKKKTAIFFCEIMFLQQNNAKILRIT